MRTILCLSCLVALVMMAAAGDTCCFADEKGAWVAKKVDDRYTGRDSTSTMEMILIDKKGIERKRNLFILRKDYDGSDKLLVKFTYPNDIKGTSFLVWEHRDEDNERFLYLPELGRVRRIASRERDENFAGTDFSYEDISGRMFEDYTYRMLKEDVVYNGHHCFVVGYYPKEKKQKYPKIITVIRRDNFVAVKGGYYNSAGKLEKNYEVLSVEKVEGIWTPLEMRMENRKTGHRTIINVKKIEYNQSIGDDRFTRSELKR